MVSAVDYNRRRWEAGAFEAPHLPPILRVARAYSDPHFAAAVQELQAQLGLKPDGMFGPATQTAVAPTPIRRVGAWASLNDRKGPATAAELGLTDIALMLNDNTKRSDWHLRTDRSRIVSRAREYQNRGIRVHLCSWVVATKTHANALLSAAPSLVQDCGAVSLELDAEEPWINRRADHAGLGQHIAEGLRVAGIRYGVTAIVYTSVPKLRTLLAGAEYASWQAYSTSTVKAKHLLPGAMQRTAHGLRSAAAPRFVMGLAAYRQRGAGGLSESRAMRAAIDATGDLGVDEVRYWSLGWLRRSPAVAAEVRALCRRVRLWGEAPHV